MPQSGYGKVVLVEHFANVVPAGVSFLDNPLGPFRVFGEGINEADSGALAIHGGQGVRLTTTDEAAHSAAVGTQQCVSPVLNGPLVLEARVQMNNLDTKTIFVGFSDDCAATALSPVTGSTVTLTLADSDLCGFTLDAGLTSDEEWHCVHNGGSATGVTVSTTVGSGVDAVAGEWDVLRVEIEVDGTARWYINGVLEKTLEGAVAPAVKFGGYAMVEATGAAIEELDVDLLAVEYYRDWTR